MSKKILTMMDIKKARDGIAAAFSVDTMTAARLIGFYNGSGDVETVAALVAGDYTSIPAAAAALGVSLQGVKAPETVGGSEKAGSIKKENRKAAHTDDITAHNGDILPDTARNNKADIPADSKSKPKKAVYNDSITASRPESVQLETNTIKDDLPRVDGDVIPPDLYSSLLPDNFSETVEQWLSDFSERYLIDLYKASGQQWRSACIYVGQNIKKRKLLFDHERLKSHGGSIIYKPEKVAALLPIWEYLTGVYKHTALVSDFIAFSGVSREWFYDSQGQGLTSARIDIVKKARAVEESALSAGLVDGRENPTGRIYYSKARLGWQEQTTVVHVSAAAAPVAPSLPVFDGAGGLLVDNSAGGVDN